MKVSGEATLAAGVAEVYAALTDPAVLVRTIPGCQRLEQTGPDTYKATVVAGVASIKGLFDGDVRLSDQSPPDSLTLHASGAGAPGTVSAVAQVTLAPTESGGTRLRYDADATIGGVIGGVGQRMLSGVAKKTAGEFFAAVDRELTGAPPAVVGPTPVTIPSVGTAAMAPSAAGAPASAAPAGVWTRPAPEVDPARVRARDLMIGAAFGAAIALLGVLIGALVAQW
jgi:carbon monoxide dehydrogenase subunit G